MSSCLAARGESFGVQITSGVSRLASRSRVSVRLLLFLVPALVALEAFASSQSARTWIEALAPRQVLTGRGVLPDGSPARGAEVASSAGGRVLTAEDGSFTLAVRVPRETESLTVTAIASAPIGGERLVAHESIVPPSPMGITALGVLVVVPSAGCQPRRLPTFGPEAGTNAVRALAVFDDGSGAALYMGGQLWQAAGIAASMIVKWDGSQWSPLGAGTNNVVHSLAVFDAGGGPALYAGGQFTSAGGSAANYVARWDGSTWSPLGSGMGGLSVPVVKALTVFDDGNGTALYAGGRFTTAGGAAASYIARWDGSSWSALGSGVSAQVLALTVFDDGNGAALYAGGYFTSAGGVAAKGIARWNGTSWAGLAGTGRPAPVQRPGPRGLRRRQRPTATWPVPDGSGDVRRQARTLELDGARLRPGRGERIRRVRGLRRRQRPGPVRRRRTLERRFRQTKKT